MKTKLINLSEFLRRNKLTKEFNQLIDILKIAMPLPPGEEIEASEHRLINLEGPESMSEEEVGENLKLKDIFLRRKDDSFIGQFKFLHFFRGDSAQAVEFINKFSESPNPTEMSVVGTRDGVCKAMNNQHFRGSGYILVMTGEPVSAFYFDASSSIGEGFMDSESYKRKLKNLGVNTDAYLPKVINVSKGRIHSFFYDEESYNEASEGRSSDYHEFILKNAKVEYMVIDNKMRLDKIYEELSDELEYGADLADKIRLCSGDIIYGSSAAVEKLERSAKSFIYHRGYHDRQSYWNEEKFENVIQNLDKKDDGYFHDRVTLEMAIEEAIDDSFMKIENIGGFISSIVDMARERTPMYMHGSFDNHKENRRKHIENSISESIHRIVDKNMDDINSISYQEDNFNKLLFEKGWLHREHNIGDITFDSLFKKGIKDFQEKLKSYGDISENNIEDLSSELDRLYGFLYSTAYIEGSKYSKNIKFKNWQSAKEEFLSLLEKVVRLPNAGREFAELIKVYKDKGEDIPYTFIEDRSIVMGQLVESPISEAHSIVRENLSNL
jgi:hypothetical protein